MFVEAEALAVSRAGEVVHFLHLRDAVSDESTTKRLRLSARRVEEVTRAGGMAISSAKQLQALKELGVFEVSIDTEKSSVLPEDLDTTGAEPSRVEVVADAPPTAEPTAEVELSVASLDVPVAGSGAVPGATWSEGDDREPALRTTIEAHARRRRSFGPEGTGWMKVDIYPKTRRAVLRVLSFGGDARLRAPDIIEGLRKEYRLRNVDRNAVQLLASRAVASPNRVIRGEFVVASNLDPEAFGRIDLSCLRGVSGTLTGRELKEAFGLPRPDQAVPLRVLTVHPQQELAVVVPSDSLVQDSDDTAPAAVPDHVAAQLLRPGRHVELREGRYLSSIYGYLCAGDEEISVVPPIWVSADRMEARFIRPPQAGPDVPLTTTWLEQLLQLAEVTEGFETGALEAVLALQAEAETTRSVLLARGTPPTVGASQEAQLMVGTTSDPTVVEAEVEADQLLAVAPIGDRPTPGRDVSGRPIAAATTNIVLMAGTNVRSQERDGSRHLYAAQAGRVQLSNQVLSVRPLSGIEGDMEGDFQIEDSDDLHVRGSVRDGSITTSGRIRVDGSATDGVRLVALEDIRVDEGIVGAETLVEADGDVASGFVEQATVVAGGNTTIRDHAENAQVSAGWVLRLGAGDDPEGGRASGGKLSAGRAIEARRVEHGHGTTLAIEPSPELQDRLAELDRLLKACRQNMLRVFRTLGVDTINAALLKRMMEKIPRARRKPMMDLVRRLGKLVKTRQKARDQRESVAEEQERIYDEASIRVVDHVDAGVEIRIGEATKVTDEMAGAVFRRQPDGTIVAVEPDES
jgi:uncharacterized protein (DUF342 family)